MGLLRRIIGKLLPEPDKTNEAAETAPVLPPALQIRFSAALASALREQRSSGDRGGIHEATIVSFVFNHERIEGSTLTSWQTQEVLESRDEVLTTSPDASEIRETANHTLMFDRLIDTLDRPLSMGLVRELHACLMDRVMPSAGHWKSLPNGVAGVAACPPSEVGASMGELVGEYLRFEPTLENIARLPARHETIHPFADGNGRTGRAIVFRELLRAGLVPLIVADDTRKRYYDALASAGRGSYDELFSYFSDMQKGYLRTFAALLPDKEVRDEVGRHIEIRPGAVPSQGEFQGSVCSLADHRLDALSVGHERFGAESKSRASHEKT